MYSAQTLVDNIKKQAKSKNVLIRDLLAECDLNVNTLSQISDKKGLSSFSLALIADNLNCSVDFLLGRTDLTNVFPIKNSSTNIQKKINLSELFNQDIPLKKYASRLWEAHKEIFEVNMLLKNLITYEPFEKIDWFIVFKYNILVLCGTARLLHPEKKQDFFEELNKFLEKPQISKYYKCFETFYTKNQNFIDRSRHIVAHFDHIKDSETYSKFISRQTNYNIYLKNNVLTDDNIYLNIIIELYKKLYNAQISDFDAIKDIISLFSKLMENEYQLLQEMLWDFYIENNVFSDNELQMISDALTNKDKSQTVDVRIVNDNHGIIGNTHAPVTIINSTEKKLTEQELALLGIFSKLDVVKQAQLLAHAAELEKKV